MLSDLQLRNDEFIETICREPDNIDARLVYADWLEEYDYRGPHGGGRDRAELIRCQCQLHDLHEHIKANPMTSLVSEIARRAELRELEVVLFRLGDGRGDLPLPYLPKEGSKVQDGTHERVWEPPGVRIIASHPGGQMPNDNPRWEFRWHRGFVQVVRCQLEDWHKWGETIVRHAPIRATRLFGYHFRTYNNSVFHTEYGLPVYPFRFMLIEIEEVRGHHGHLKSVWQGEEILFRNLKDMELVVREAAILWARRKVGFETGDYRLQQAKGVV